jgi:poly(A) polymerase
MQLKDAQAMRRSTLRRLLLRPTFPLELELHRLDCLGSIGELDTYEYLARERAEVERRPELRPPLLSGHDLMSLGMRPGPAMGALLSEIRERQLEDHLKTKAEAMAWAAARLRAPADSESAPAASDSGPNDPVETQSRPPDLGAETFRGSGRKST